MTALRRADAADAAAIAALTRRAYAKWVAVIGREPLPMQVDYVEALTRHRFDLLERDGALLGLIETAVEDDCLLIVNLAFDPAAQRQGHGRRLLRWAEELARQAGLRGLKLYTNQRMVENVAFYRRCGFAIGREAPLNGGVAVYMTKALPALE